MKQWGYGAGYQHAHKFEDALPDMECLPESLSGYKILRANQPRPGAAYRGTAGRDPGPQEEAGHFIP